MLKLSALPIWSGSSSFGLLEESTKGRGVLEGGLSSARSSLKKPQPSSTSKDHRDVPTLYRVGMRNLKERGYFGGTSCTNDS